MDMDHNNYWDKGEKVTDITLAWIPITILQTFLIHYQICDVELLELAQKLILT